MSKKTKIILSFIVVLVLLIGAIIYANKSYDNKNATPEVKTISKLDDPALVYASQYWAGLCGNGKGESGGCYDEIYLYKTGRLAIYSGFVKFGDIRKIDPTVEKNLGVAMVDQVIKKIKDSGVMAKDCPPQQIMDVGWDHQVTINGVKKSFHDVSSDCRDTFDEVDNFLNNAVETVSPTVGK